MLTDIKIIMYRAYKYVFYRIYLWYLRKYGKKHLPHHNAMFGVSILSFFNILTLLAIIEGITRSGFGFITIINLPTIYVAVIAIIYLFINYFVLLYKQKYKLIIQEFEKENKKQHKQGTIYVLAYIIGTHIALLGAVLIIRPPS